MNKIITKSVKVAVTAGALAAALTGCCLFGSKDCCKDSCCCETMCCGQAMRELVPGTTDGAAEKHVPVYTVEGDTVKVKVGSAEHPMADAHHIEWIAIETENGNQRKELKPGDKPEATFALVPRDTVKSVYEYCNLHGLWKA